MKLLIPLLIATLMGSPALANEKTQSILLRGERAPFSGVLLTEELYRSFVASKETAISLSETNLSLTQSLEQEKAGRVEEAKAASAILALKEDEIRTLKFSLEECLVLAKKPIVITEEPGVLDSPVFWGIVGIVAGGVIGTLITIEIKD